MPRRVLEGNVISDKNDKTITVLVERRYMNPMYKKYVKRTDKFRAHDENNQYKVGDRVSIVECRPISRSKRWTVLTGAEETRLDADKKAKDTAAKQASADKKAGVAAKKAAKPKAGAKAKTADKKPADKKTTKKADKKD